MNLIQLKNISFFDEQHTTILSNISLKVETNDFIVLLGKNGSGKTTLCEIICGLKQISQGEILYKGNKITNRKEILGKTSMIFQNPENQLINNIVKYNLAFSLEVKRVSQIEMDLLIDEALIETNSLSLKNEDVINLSGGQLQNVAISDQLILNRELIIFDEVTSFLDKLAKQKIISILKNLHKKGKTIILITQEYKNYVENQKVWVIEKSKLIYNVDSIKKNLPTIELLEIFGGFSISLSLELSKYFKNFPICFSKSEIIAKCKSL